MWRLTNYPADQIEADIIVAGTYERQEIDESSLHLAQLMGTFAFSKLKETRLGLGDGMLMTPPQRWKAPWILWLGLGEARSFSRHTLKQVLDSGMEKLQGIGIERPCFALIGEGSALNNNIAWVAEEITSNVHFKNGKIFHPRKEVLYQLFASIPNRFYYELWSLGQQGKRG
jgi:hypothetical protein